MATDTSPPSPVSTAGLDHPVVNAEQWRRARIELMTGEKALTRQLDQLASARRALPWMEITTDYRFTTLDGGEVGLAELFDGRGQLLVYHFMMGPDWEEGCPSCSFWADNYNGTQNHLAHRDTTLVAVSRAPIDAIAAYRRRMGWDFTWVSSLGSRFNYDMGVSFEPEAISAGRPDYNFGTITFGGEEAPGLSAFRRLSPASSEDGGGTSPPRPDRVFLTYQTFSRGLDLLNGAYQLLDMTAKGRDEDSLEWSMQWLHRHDAYPD
jgi:predicted dithiol-disulfide oxidoreductase (DUF899 family)